MNDDEPTLLSFPLDRIAGPHSGDTDQEVPDDAVPVLLPFVRPELPTPDAAA